MTGTSTKLVHVGALRGPHGLRGQVKAKLELEDAGLVVSGGPLLAEDGRTFKVIQVQRAGQGMVALTVDGVSTVEAAEALKGVKVYLDRANWPATEGEVYLEDVVGMAVTGPDGHTHGTVEKVVDLPAGPAISVGGKLVPMLPEFLEVDEAVVLTALGEQLLSV